MGKRGLGLGKKIWATIHLVYPNPLKTKREAQVLPSTCLRTRDIA